MRVGRRGQLPYLRLIDTHLRLSPYSSTALVVSAWYQAVPDERTFVSTTTNFHEIRVHCTQRLAPTWFPPSTSLQHVYIITGFRIIRNLLTSLIPFLEQHERVEGARYKVTRETPGEAIKATGIPIMWVDYAGAARVTGLSRWTIAKAVDDGELHPVREGRAVRFEVRELDSWMRSKARAKAKSDTIPKSTEAQGL